MIAGWPALTDADRAQLKELRDWLHVLARMDDRPQHAADSMLIARLIDENEALRECVAVVGEFVYADRPYDWRIEAISRVLGELRGNI